MYLDHFGLNESPFAITPDPRFVFLSERHREALAHLLYGLGEGGGFVQLTGEVGTGKTTICRTLLQQLPEHVDVALVFNPQLTVPELLDSLCTELGIARPDVPTDSIKARIDWLYAYLLDANARGRRTVLIIDEAQNLGMQLLEEVRLLTNLETDHAKLLQVFLIGQPELRDKLSRDDLRQLAQRVTARYHLEPLSLDEARLYVRHRLSVSGCSREVFTPGAVRLVHRLAKGIPRRINILCDRALLGAYTTDADRVSTAIVRRAAAEVRGTHRPVIRAWLRHRHVAGGAVAAGVVAFALTAFGPQLTGLTERLGRTAAAQAAAAYALVAEHGPWSATPSVAPSLPEPAPETAAITPVPHDAVAEEPIARLVDHGAGPPPADVAPGMAALLSVEPSLDGPPPAAPAEPVAGTEPGETVLEELVVSLDHDGWESAVDGLARLWGVPGPLPGVDTCVWALEQSLACHSRSADWATLRELDLPAVLRLRGPRATTVHALMIGQTDSHATVAVAGRELHVERAVLERLWGGRFLLLWRPPVRNVHQIMLGHSGQRVRWLHDSLASIDGIEPTAVELPRFDAGLQDRVKAFQRSHGLDVDGIVGPETFIHIAKQTSGGELPSLRGTSDVVAAAEHAAAEMTR